MAPRGFQQRAPLPISSWPILSSRLKMQNTASLVRAQFQEWELKVFFWNLHDVDAASPQDAIEPWSGWS